MLENGGRVETHFSRLDACIIPAYSRFRLKSTRSVVGHFESSAETPLLSRGGESRRGSGGWGGAGQQNHSLDQHHLLRLRAIALALRARLRGLRWLRNFFLPRSHPSSSEEGSLIVQTSE